ncbi:MAG: hypothetical protein IKF35_11565, partial [Solobacterium sp.]|nr:hypothetical protein [Solobacterium sp.]
SLLLCFESVFTVLAGFFFLHEILTMREMGGCALIFLAAVLSQVHVRNLIHHLPVYHLHVKAR